MEEYGFLRPTILAAVGAGKRNAISATCQPLLLSGAAAAVFCFDWSFRIRVTPNTRVYRLSKVCNWLGLARYRLNLHARSMEERASTAIGIQRYPSCPALWHSPTLRYHASCGVLFVWVIC